MSYAGIRDEIVLFALQEHIELWSKDEYEKMIAQEPEDFSQIADEIFGKSDGSENSQ